MPPALAERPAKASPFGEHDRVRLAVARRDAGLGKGAEGTIVHLYEDGGYEVEFLAGIKRPVVLTVESAEIEGLNSGL